ncbi:family 16 glycoside hydrolase [Microvirga massiliensis]|uniref:family 16 glycoside hydrolase n=1 Tax=Microvirga massiliensis TaxID=1033741 RepID=UPI00062B6D4F|nr:family 16 glycoside hydrolase [Microvirga massiliensis]
MLGSETTTFTLDNMGRHLCNTFQEAVESAAEVVGGHDSLFDVIVIGGGTFGAAVAQRLFENDSTRARRILVLEAGPFVLPEHVQNTNYLNGGVPDMRTPWESHSALDYKGLLFAIGGRSLSWGGWSPELFEDETKTWPKEVMDDLRAMLFPNNERGYFWQSSDLIGVTETNDFIYGPLHVALRKQLHAGLNANPAITGLSFADLPEHPAVRYHDPATQGPINADVLRDWLGLPQGDATPEPKLRELFKLEAPLAVQSQAAPGQFPGNKFSTVPILTCSARLATAEADGIGPQGDARKRLMVVPKVNVLDLITETLADNTVRVTGVRVLDNGAEKTISLAPPQNGFDSAVIIALGTVESTRLAKLTFQQSLSWRAASRMGKNLVAHLRSNLTIRVPKKSIEQHLPATLTNALQVSALLVKGRALIEGQHRYFHFQITASGLNNLGVDSEAELFKKIPTLEHMDALLRADDTHVVITIRGIGEMCPGNPDSHIDLDPTLTENGRAKAVVSLGNAKAKPEVFPGSNQTKIDRKLWDAMDECSDKLAVLFAAGEPFEIITNEPGPKKNVISVTKNATANDLKALLPWDNRRDNLGTTHHDAGTLWMSKNAADGVTDIYGCIHDTRNCYVASPAIFPTVGSPNPMLTGVALARRTADKLSRDVLPRAKTFPAPAGWTALFDGTAASVKAWSKVGPDGTGFAHLNGELVSYGDSGLTLFFYTKKAFKDFTLKLQFRIFNPDHHNSGVYIRFAHPRHPLDAALMNRLSDAEKQAVRDNPVLRPIHSGFEVQIDDNARGDSSIDFWGIPEKDGLWRHRTGAIYNIPAGDRIWHLDRNEERWQEYDASGPKLIKDVWFEYEITAQGNLFTVKLTNTETGESKQTTRYDNTDPLRGQGPGYVGIQAYPGSQVAYRTIHIKG